MTLDDALGNEQTESHTPAVVFRQLDEALEHGFQLMNRNAFTGVADAIHNVVVNLLEAHDDGALRGGELECIAQKVAQHLKDARGIIRN